MDRSFVADIQKGICSTGEYNTISGWMSEWVGGREGGTDIQTDRE